MNKLFLSLAIASLVFFTACSDDKETRADICKNSKKIHECLVGTWTLNKVEEGNGSEVSRAAGTLILDKDGSLEFSGGEQSFPVIIGRWTVSETILKITYLEVDPEIEVSGEISSSDGYETMRVKSEGRAAVSRFQSGMVDRPVEVFTYNK